MEMTQVLHCCYTVVTRLSHGCRTVVTLLLLQGLGSVIGNILVGVLHDRYGGYDAVLLFLLALATVDLALSLLLLRSTSRAPIADSLPAPTRRPSIVVFDSDG
jgi:predicted MFS family arabinose efflux permease